MTATPFTLEIPDAASTPGTPVSIRDADSLSANGTPEYAREELVAELGSAFLCAALGIASAPRADHASYLASWLKLLEDEPRAVFDAATQPQQAAEFLHAQHDGAAAA